MRGHGPVYSSQSIHQRYSTDKTERLIQSNSMDFTSFITAIADFEFRMI